MKSLDDQLISCVVNRAEARRAGDSDRADAWDEMATNLKAKIARRDALAGLQKRPSTTSAIGDELKTVDHAVEGLPRHERAIMLREVREAWSAERKKAEPAD